MQANLFFVQVFFGVWTPQFKIFRFDKKQSFFVGEMRHCCFMSLHHRERRLLIRLAQPFSKAAQIFI